MYGRGWALMPSQVWSEDLLFWGWLSPSIFIWVQRTELIRLSTKCGNLLGHVKVLGSHYAALVGLQLTVDQVSLEFIEMYLPDPWRQGLLRSLGWSGAQYAAKGRLKLVTILSQPPNCWKSRHKPVVWLAFSSRGKLYLFIHLFIFVGPGINPGPHVCYPRSNTTVLVLQ